jgi:hypothetical protein
MRETVDKSEFDWNVTQVDPSTWQIGRFDLKFDQTLTLTVADGRITGTLDKP